MSLRVLIILLFIYDIALYAGWQPKEAPLMTSWGENIDPYNVLPEYPRPQLQRTNWINLNGLWQFEQAGADDAVPTGAVVLQDTILVPFPVESALSGIMQQINRMWYKRHFSYQAKYTDEKVLLHFGAVDWHSKIWINGTLVGEHKGGYDPFSIDISAYVHDGGDNELIVWVYDPTDEGQQPIGKQKRVPESIWFTSCSGIWQTVWLEQLPSFYITDVEIRTNIENGTIYIDPQVNDPGVNANLKALVRLNDNIVYQKEMYGVNPFTVTLSDARLWSPEDPVLYDIEIILDNLTVEDDTVRTYTGLRKIHLGKDKNGYTRIMLNNKVYFNLGPLDQGYWPDGVYTAPGDEALKFDIEYAKKLGFNMIRKHVKVEPARWYYWADKIGMLVWQDMPNGKNETPEARTQFQSELTAMIENLKHFPSIVQWVVFNENWGKYNAPAVVTLVEQLDSTRLINQNSGWNVGGFDDHVGNINDLHAYPGPVAPSPENERAGICGEYGGIWSQPEGHSWTEFTGEGYQDPNDIINAYSSLSDSLQKLIETRGLSAGVYTEITDVEKEYAGFISYDRKYEKVNYLPVYFTNRNTIATAMTEPHPAQPRRFELYQNFPNPFNPSTVIGYVLDSPAHVELAVYNVLGQKIATFLNGKQPAGEHKVTVEMGDMPSGVYYYRLSTGKLQKTRKMVLLR
ncbi:MAG TPA: T9SS type A sorting domain-containing protein [Caldithrix abyssi]|uniref:T9SS type A sorting domain-containing protein n=1 Tax=Caldithrix abyssi TaxID=187145 RepID=A0A7V4U2I4_CALAY|nr:T9SS type A sorting domain-containing protein [Caldithrix abyssi]